MHPAKAIGQNEMPFGRVTDVVPSNIVLDRGPGPHGKGRFGGSQLCCLLPNYLDFCLLLSTSIGGSDTNSISNKVNLYVASKDKGVTSICRQQQQQNSNKTLTVGPSSLALALSFCIVVCIVLLCRQNSVKMLKILLLVCFFFENRHLLKWYVLCQFYRQD